MKRFEKVFLKAGEQKSIQRVIQARDLAYFDERKDHWFAKAGKFEIHLAASRRNIRLSSSFTLTQGCIFEED